MAAHSFNPSIGGRWITVRYIHHISQGNLVGNYLKKKGKIIKLGKIAHA